jgi:hypothetical protein
MKSLTAQSFATYDLWGEEIMAQTFTAPKRQAVPFQLGGKWIAWSSDGTRIVASGDTLDECERAGEKDPSFEKTPRPEVRIIGARR